MSTQKHEEWQFDLNTVGDQRESTEGRNQFATCKRKIAVRMSLIELRRKRRKYVFLDDLVDGSQNQASTPQVAVD